MSELLKAKLKVMEAVPYLQKTDSGELGYTFASEADLIHKLRPAMIENGLSLACTGIQVMEPITGRTTRSGNPWNHQRAVVTYAISHESGESESVHVLAEAQDTQDKAFPKLLTIAQKYCLRQYFLIETGDDPDVVWEASDDEPTSKYLKAAIKKITACKTPDQLAEQLEKIRVAEHPETDGEEKSRPLFNPDQLSELERMASRHLKELE